MKKYLFLILLSIISNLTFSQNKEIKPYVDFLKSNNKQSAKDYILQKFKNHDIVILCERDHRDLSQYLLIKEILEDKYFQKHVGNIFTEIGVVNLNPEINNILKSTNLDSATINRKFAEFQQNCSYHPIWEKYNYQFLLKTIYAINKKSKHKISYFPSEVEFDWYKVIDSKDYEKKLIKIEEERDKIIADNIIKNFKGLKHKKALIILNYRHAFNRDVFAGKEKMENASRYLFDFFGKKATNILINGVYQDLNGKTTLLQSGKWDASFKYLNIENLGFDFKNSPFGTDNFDFWPFKNTYKYNDIFDGFVFYKPVEKYKIAWNFDGFVPKEFEDEFIRRFKIGMTVANRDISKFENPEYRKAIIKDFNTKREKDYPEVSELIKQRDKYLSE